MIELEPTNKQAVTEKLAITKLLAEEFKKREEGERRLNEGDDEDEDEEKEEVEKEKKEVEKDESKKSTKEEESVKQENDKQLDSQAPLKTKQIVSGIDMIESQTRYFKEENKSTNINASSSSSLKQKEPDENSDKLPESKKPKHVESLTTSVTDTEKEKMEQQKQNVTEEKKTYNFLPDFPETLPRTLQEFTLLWKSYESDRELRAKLLFLLPPEKIPQFFKDSVTPAFLGEIISILQEYGTKIDAQKTLGWMEALPGVGRFMMLWFGLSQKDKQSK